MSMNGKHVILTGAAGGIGQQLAQRLDQAGASLSLVDLSDEGLKQTSVLLNGNNHLGVAVDLTTEDGRSQIIQQTLDRYGRIDTLINCAGINPFGVFAEQDPAVIQKTLDINLVAPMMLTHAVLPHMQQQGSGHIVNIGSTFGSIGFAWFTAYSTSKFGLRGFSQSLRRELDGSGIDVTYVAPRAVKTAINSQAVYEMAEKVKMNFDEPSVVADKIMHAIEGHKRDVYIGFPESLFVRINAVAPGIVDNALRKQNKVAQSHATRENPTT
ncbi:MAG: SDR family oxidoreductase [Gammaproteobacteria bacterium]|nr:SDR family oxidoreductase [Gammaproteobacteria bacterium]